MGVSSNLIRYHISFMGEGVGDAILIKLGGCMHLTNEIEHISSIFSCEIYDKFVPS